MNKTIEKSQTELAAERPVRLTAQDELQEDTIDLLELFFVLLSHWKIILLVVFLFGGIAGLYNKYMVKPMYQAKAQIYITNTDEMISIQNVQLSAALTVDYE